MSLLILVKHASPAVVEGTPPAEWQLSDQGRSRCGALAERLRQYKPARLFSSEETKAVQTGQIIGKLLGIPSESRPGLQEHDRANVPQMRSREFISMMELAFRRGGECVLGAEAVNQAAHRFETALRDILDQNPGENVVVVSHGTVLASWLSPRLGQKPFDLWRKLGLPSFVVLTQPGFELIELADKVETEQG